jgi:hypothetical protein
MKKYVTAEHHAELLACPSNNAFAALQTQIANLSATIQDSHTPTLKVHQPLEFNGSHKDIQEFLVHCDLNFAAAPALFPTDDWKIVFVTLHLSGIVFK